MSSGLLNTHNSESVLNRNRPVRYFAFACDYDGTIASNGAVAESTLEALNRLKTSGRKIVLVTGRRLDDLKLVFPALGAFDRIVAENGALVYRPETDESRLIASPPSPRFIEELASRGVSPLETGACIVATREPNDTVVLSIIRDLGLELQVIYNKGAVMILPSGVNKSTGTLAALHELGISPHNTAAIGDAENDHALLEACAVSVAVNNSIATLREEADIITEAPNGLGVQECIAALLENDLHGVPDRRGRSRILLGLDHHEEVFLNYGMNVLIAGPSASGKSTIVHGLLERILEANYQVCLLDPEGDYEQVEGVICLGTPSRAPEIGEVLKALENPSASVTVNLLGISLQDRPQFFGALLSRLQEMRSRVGRPHWIIFDEAHHLMPAAWLPTAEMPELEGIMLVTVHPESVSAETLKKVRAVVAVGENPKDSIRNFAAAARWRRSPHVPHWEPGKVVVAFREQPGKSLLVAARPPQKEVRRHKRKYAEGQLGEDRSFYFRGPEGRLNLQAHNLAMFIQMARGVDDDTWMHHLRRHHYSGWLRASIKDSHIADEVLQIENDMDISAATSRERIFAALQQKYTADDGKPAG